MCRPRQRRFTYILHAAILWGISEAGLPPCLIHVTSVLDAWWILSGVLGGGMLGLFLLRLSRKVNHPTAATAILLG